MTRDALVRFAAEKLGHKLKTVQALQGGVDYTKSTMDSPDVVLACGIDMTSPELFLKGLEVCPHRVAIKTSPDANERYVSIIPHEGKFAMRWYDKVEEIPAQFWTAWAELEGGQG